MAGVTEKKSQLGKYEICGAVRSLKADPADRTLTVTIGYMPHYSKATQAQLMVGKIRHDDMMT